MDSLDDPFNKVATTVISEMRVADIQVRDVRTWHEAYYHGYTENPFRDIIKDTYRNTRSKYIPAYIYIIKQSIVDTANQYY